MQNKPIKKIPERRCVGCNTSKPKYELIRVVRAPDSSVSIDFKGKKSGRGVYLCKSTECFKKAVKAKRLDHNLGVNIPEDIINELLLVIERGSDVE